MAHYSSEGNLLIGDTSAAIFDCGMAFCANETIEKAKAALDGRPLGYIFLSHTHYDHIGALPFFKEEWPEARVATSETGAAVLLKDTPRRVIRELSVTAAKTFGAKPGAEYSDEAFAADMTVKDGDIIDLGGTSVRVLETPGHTRDSLSFFIEEPGILILNESLGVLMPDDNIYPCYLTSYEDTMRSIEKCERIPYKALSLPHRGIVKGGATEHFFDNAKAVIKDCHDFILYMSEKMADEEALLEAFYHRYSNEVLSAYQPKEAFMANARATISCTLREVNQQIK